MDVAFNDDNIKRFELIVVDMDGILSNFRKGVCKIFNLDIKDIKGIWHLDRLVETLLNKNFWEEIDKTENFWLNLEMFDYAKELMSMIEKYTNEVIICTHPNNSSGAYMQKKEWLIKHEFGEYKIFIGDASKAYLATPERLLIDDFIKNIMEFRSREGKTIIFPQDYNLSSIPLLDLPDNYINYIENKIIKLLRK